MRRSDIEQIIAEQLAEAEARFERGEITRQRIWQIRRQLKGVCRICGKSKSLCGHVRALSDYNTERYRQAHGVTLERQKTCSNCGNKGHNKRKCTELKK